MKTFHVHRYDVIRIKVAVEAADQAEAMKKVDEYLIANHPFRNFYLPGDADSLPTWLEVENAEEVTGYLVDVVGDTDFEQTRSYNPDHTPAN